MQVQHNGPGGRIDLMNKKPTSFQSSERKNKEPLSYDPDPSEIATQDPMILAKP
jgi:hypothetical protein